MMAREKNNDEPSAQPLAFPLHGSRLIEASAGTGKTWTIAALYVRLVLGHGGDDSRFARPLLPADILVMTFTRAATRELSNRVRERLIEAAAYFRHESGIESGGGDPFLDALLESYPDESERQKAAHRLMLAAETMDEAAIFTIDAWCQRIAARARVRQRQACSTKNWSATSKPCSRMRPTITGASKSIPCRRRRSTCCWPAGPTWAR